MKTRVITGSFIFIFFAAVAITSLWLSNLVFDAFVLFLMFFGAYEMSKAFLGLNTKPLLFVIFPFIAVSYATFVIAEHLSYDGMSAYFLTAIAFLIILLIAKLFAKKLQTNDLLSTIFVMVYPVTVMAYMLGLNYFMGGDNAFRSVGILLFFLVSPFTDSMAYFVGSALKGAKLCPKISPKKTVSGAIGGLLGGILAAIIVFFLAKSGVLDFMGLTLFGRGNDFAHFLALGFLGAVATQAGDLVASYVKRKCNIKDYGNLLPGHGGVMDRVDGMIFSAVVYYVYFLFLCV